jgi:phage FluMu protein Com
LTARPQALAEIAAMMLKTKCSRCKHKIEFTDAQSGHTIFCPQCNKELTLKVPKSTYLKILFWTWGLMVLLIGGGFAAYSMFPGVKKTAQGVWKGIVGLFDPVGASRRR